MEASALATAPAYVGLSRPPGRRAGATRAEAAGEEGISMGALPLALELGPAVATRHGAREVAG